MNKLHTLLVATKKISSNVPATNFDSQVIAELADLIIEAGGLINPLVIRRTSIDSFEVVSGHLEYYAAVRAREINLRAAEMINAYVLDGTDKDKAITKQINLTRNSQPQVSLDKEPAPITARSIELAQAIASLSPKEREKMMRGLPQRAIDLIHQYL